MVYDDNGVVGDNQSPATVFSPLAIKSPVYTHSMVSFKLPVSVSYSESSKTSVRVPPTDDLLSSDLQVQFSAAIVRHLYHHVQTVRIYI